MKNIKEIVKACLIMMADAPYEYVGLVYADHTYSVFHRSKFFLPTENMTDRKKQIVCIIPKWFIQNYGWSPNSDNEKIEGKLYNLLGNYWSSRTEVINELVDEEIGVFPEYYQEAEKKLADYEIWRREI